MSQKNLEKTTKITAISLPKILKKAGVFLVGSALTLFVVIFYPTILSELKYLLIRPPNTSAPIAPVDSFFGIIIPKIRVNTSVIPNVNAYDQSDYQKALTNGVAHAEGTVFPGQIGNTFLFAHSSADFYEANKYNSSFYLIRKLNLTDTFYLSYKNTLYTYEVVDKIIVNPSAINYLKEGLNNHQATLMTGWPAGTTLKRVLIIGDLRDTKKLPIL